MRCICFAGGDSVVLAVDLTNSLHELFLKTKNIAESHFPALLAGDLAEFVATVSAATEAWQHAGFSLLLVPDGPHLGKTAELQRKVKGPGAFKQAHMRRKWSQYELLWDSLSCGRLPRASGRGRVNSPERDNAARQLWINSAMEAIKTAGGNILYFTGEADDIVMSLVRDGTAWAALSTATW